MEKTSESKVGSQGEDWEKEFDNEIFADGGGHVDSQGVEYIRNFIRQTVATIRQETWRDAVEAAVPEKAYGNARADSMIWFLDGWNAARAALVSKAKEAGVNLS
jgi:hypothetical protein